MKRLLFKLKEDNRGQTLILVALGMAVFLGFAAISVDYGYLAFQKRNIQNAADAGALAGAQVLYNTSVAEATAINVAEENKGSDNYNAFVVIPTTPYDGDPTKIEVVVEAKVPSMFARILGVEESDLEARAVARQYWDGQALPLVNTGYVYTKEDLELRINKSPGDKSQIFDFFTVTDENGENDYGVRWSDGLVLDQGNGNTTSELDGSSLKPAMEDLFKPKPSVGTEYYLFSLKEDLIEGFMDMDDPQPVTVTDKHGNTVERTEKNGGFKKGDILRPQDLVLLKVAFLDIKNANQTELELRFVEEIDVSNPANFPDDFISTSSGYAYLAE